MVRGLGILAAVALAACSAAESGPASAQSAPLDGTERADASGLHAESGLQLIDVIIDSGGTRHVFVSELAASNEEQARGLMFRTSLGADEGMLFPSYQPQNRSFWMKNTPSALDIIFIGPDMRITNIEAGVPYSLDSVHSEGPAIAVFEIRAGRSEELGIKPGDLVNFTLPQ